MKQSILAILLIIALPFLLKSQQKNETFLSIGISSAKYNISYLSEDPSPHSVFLGIDKSWNKKNDQSLSFVKQIGLGFKYTDLSRERGGIAARDIYNSFYLHAFINASVMIQKRFSESVRIQIGPKVESLIIGYESGEKTGWGWRDPDTGTINYSGDKEYSEFNRNYFDQLYYGPEIRVLTLTQGNSSIGFSFGYLFTKETESNFETGHMLRFATFIEL